MTRRLCFLALFALVFSNLLMAQRWWDKKSYTEWSAIDLDEMLNASPWVGFVVTNLKIGSPDPDRLSRYCIRLVTARPIREALLRVSTRPTVDVRQIDGFEREDARMQEFIESNPNDIRVRGDGKHIVFSLSLVESSRITVRIIRRTKEETQQEELYQKWEVANPEELMQARLADLDKVTFLTTNTGKRIALVRYDPPGRDHIGAKLYFSRSFPDGTPFIADGDKELHFQTRIQGRTLKAKFDLRKMIYKGQLEL